MKRIPILPTLVTLGNAICGFLAISYVLKAQTADAVHFAEWIGWAGWLIFFAMVCDALDGKIARLSRATSDFGAELDSLCDVISFGVAPALIVRTLAIRNEFLPRVAWATSILFMVCAALRLARYNVETEESDESHMFFKGLPTPAAAGFIAALTIMFADLHEEAAAGRDLAILARGLLPMMEGLLYVTPFVAVILALLMISNVRYSHLMNKLLRGQEPLDYLVKMLLVVIFVVLTKPFSLPILFGLYIAFGIAGWIKDQLFSHMPAEARDGT